MYQVYVSISNSGERCILASTREKFSTRHCERIHCVGVHLSQSQCLTVHVPFHFDGFSVAVAISVALAQSTTVTRRRVLRCVRVSVSLLFTAVLVSPIVGAAVPCLFLPR